MIYLTNRRPNIIHVVKIIFKYMKESNKAHFSTTKRILKYVKGTKMFSILYKLEYNSNLIGYTDNDCIGSIDDHKSASGYVFLLKSKVISWTSKK